MLKIYRLLTYFSAPLLEILLLRRQKRGKEHETRLSERQGIAGRKKPAKTPLLWLHAASVGESQSALALINALLAQYPGIQILVTSGTMTSARLMEKTLPARAFHQFYPLDHPDWTARFLDHWQPDAILWMESELWPNMLQAVKDRKIPAALINARLSDSSFKNWNIFKGAAKTLLETFKIILAQTRRDRERFETLGAASVTVTDNLKYSAAPLAYDAKDLEALKNVTANRDIWIFASTHKGEEELACRVHKALKASAPALLTIIVPRHPERRDDIRKICEAHRLSHIFRGDAKNLPAQGTDIYIVDTMGELGLFYRLALLACIGRSFSDDGGGGHNPIEAAQLDCAVLYGPHVQFQQDIFDDMKSAKAATQIHTAEELENTLLWLINNPAQAKDLQEKAKAFAADKNTVLARVLQELQPILENAGIALTQAPESFKNRV
jgi:3-deoxy-D-manno-octulosonic-acid transferase